MKEPKRRNQAKPKRRSHVNNGRLNKISEEKLKTNCQELACCANANFEQNSEDCHYTIFSEH